MNPDLMLIIDQVMLLIIQHFSNESPIVSPVSTERDQNNETSSSRSDIFSLQRSSSISGGNVLIHCHDHDYCVHVASSGSGNTLRRGTMSRRSAKNVYTSTTLIEPPSPTHVSHTTISHMTIGHMT